MAVVYPYILKQYGTFETFLDVKPNKKAGFFDKFVEAELIVRMKERPDRNKITCRNRLLRIMWGVQGFLGYLSGVEGENYKANSKLLEDQLPTPDFTSSITPLDLLELFDEMPGEGRRRLKFLFWTTWNGIDAVQFCMNDIHVIDTAYGKKFWVQKWRRKTRKKKIIYLNLFEPPMINELERYAMRKGIDENEPIFSKGIKDEEGEIDHYESLQTCSLRAYFKYWGRKTGLSELVGPKNIRALGITRLRNILKDDNELLNIWTQHNTSVITKHYTKDLIERFAERLPQINKAVGIENVSVLTEKVKIADQNFETAFKWGKRAFGIGSWLVKLFS
ncbi:MAG: hypothetical protein ACFFG0_41180 [Candidatus Thorarchaeota archaeon]